VTSRQRLLCAFRGETPDRVPVAPFGLGLLDPGGEAAVELIRKTDPLLVSRTGVDPVLGSGCHVHVVQEGADTTTRIDTPRGTLTPGGSTHHGYLGNG